MVAPWVRSRGILTTYAIRAATGEFFASRRERKEHALPMTKARAA
jgi:hypothetical protein